MSPRHSCVVLAFVTTLGGLTNPAQAQITPIPRVTDAPPLTGGGSPQFMTGFMIDLGLGARFEGATPFTQNLGAYPGTLDRNPFFAFDIGFRAPLVAVGDLLGNGLITTVQAMGRFSVSSGGGDLLLGGIQTGRANITQFDLMAGAQVRVPVAVDLWQQIPGSERPIGDQLSLNLGVRNTDVVTTDVYVGVLGGGSFVGASGGPFPTVFFQGGDFAPAVRGIVGIQTPLYISPNLPVMIGLEYQVQYTGGVDFGSNFAGERFRLGGRVAQSAMLTFSIAIQESNLLRRGIRRGQQLFLP